MNNNQEKEKSKVKLYAKGLAISLVLIGVIFGAFFYLFLIPINVRSIGFWVASLISITALFYPVSLVFAKDYNKKNKAETVLYAILGTAVVLLIIIVLYGSIFFRAKSYSKVIKPSVTIDDFTNYKATLDTVPLLDKKSALLLANRKMGSLEDVVSQFEINDSEQITVNGESVRISLLDYAGFFKWLNNRKEGTPGYIKVDMREQKAEIVRSEDPIKYTERAYFGKNITRYIRFKYPTVMFFSPSVELDENGLPFWIAPIRKNTIGPLGGADVDGIIIVNASTGEHKRYNSEDIPEWVDNVYPSDLLIAQYDNYGKFQDGYLNTIFGQKGVKETTKGYNYIPQGDDNWIYTGVTSVARDESNIGFVLMNKRTKETIYYSLGGAEEYSAMSSAEGLVQHLEYKSTFPLLLQIEDQPTYLVSLKDSGGLVKLYAMVNVENYQIVVTGNTIKNTKEKYRELLIDNDIEVPNYKHEEIDDVKTEEEDEEIEKEEITGVVISITSAIKSGNTHFYLELEDEGIHYEINIVDNEEVLFLKTGDKVVLEFEKIEKNILPANLK